MDVNASIPKGFNDALAHGNFRFNKNLGEGSFGKVVTGVNKLDYRFYAIKMMICNSDEQLEYLRREVDMLTSNQDLSKSCHIIQYYDSWSCLVEGKRVFCIQMELCWLSLHELLCRNPSIVQDGDFYKHVFRQILLGLEVIHNSRLLHRDIYPPNILIANPKPKEILNIVVKIADFGLATKLESSNNPSMPPNGGNLAFRAPEMSKENYTTKVDMYSAGLVLYLLCCYLTNYENVWYKEIVAVRNKKRGEDNLCHKDKLVIALLHGLLKDNPEQRLSASEALAILQEAETDGVSTTSWPNVKVFARGNGDTAYSRCHFPIDSFAGLSQGIQDSFGVSKDNQIICQEREKNGKTSMVKVCCEQDVSEMMGSAEMAGREVWLEVTNKDAPETVISNRGSFSEEVSNADME